MASQEQIDDALILVADALADRKSSLSNRITGSPTARGPARSEQRRRLRSTPPIAPPSSARAAEAPSTMSYRRRYPFARLNSQGRSVEAQTLLAEIYGWFTEGFDTPALSEAKPCLTN